ncbi:MAG: 5-(carboxyamino)imidazole ribonucleotide mutase [Pseudomonadota bacterium]
MDDQRDQNVPPAAGPSSARVAVVMGSQSDWATMAEASALLERLGVAHETRIISAHRTPDRLFAFAEEAEARGLRAVIAGAGGAAHLPGMLAAKTPVPVLGVPVRSQALNGLDSLLSIVQMPKGVPVATFAIGAAGAQNAALFAAAMLAAEDREVASRLADFRAAQTAAVAEAPTSGDSGADAGAPSATIDQTYPPLPPEASG